ncbi:hypothetical protein F170042I7_20640 [Blautia caecimuris]|mgnify:CR=1 FL=1|uniref:hypothetical protein n=1 Tax=Blautia caecimuris TaxID=1796615 RepID=UPI0034BB5F68
MRRQNEQAKYLRITIHDNDYSISLKIIGNTLNNLFDYHYEYPTEEDLPKISSYIQSLWHSVHGIHHVLKHKTKSKEPLSNFKPTLQIVDYLDIPDWDNYESIYVPLFDESNEIIYR